MSCCWKDCLYWCWWCDQSWQDELCDTTEQHLYIHGESVYSLIRGDHCTTPHHVTQSPHSSLDSVQPLSISVDSRYQYVVVTWKCTKWARNKIALEAVDGKTKYERVFWLWSWRLNRGWERSGGRCPWSCVWFLIVTKIEKETFRQFWL